MSSRNRLARVGEVSVDTKSSPPSIDLPVLRWEYGETYEKDEDFEIVVGKDGYPVVGDSWVTIFLAAPDGNEICLDVDRKVFDRYLFRLLLTPSLNFWEDVKPGHPFYSKKAKAMEQLLEQKSKVGRMIR